MKCSKLQKEGKGTNRMDEWIQWGIMKWCNLEQEWILGQPSDRVAGQGGERGGVSLSWVAQDPNFGGQPPDLMLVGEEVTSGVLQPEVGAVLEDILGLNSRHSLTPSTSMGMMGGPECKLSIWNPFATLILTPSSLTGLLQDKEHVTESLSSLLLAAVAAAPQPLPDPRPTPKN